MEIVTWEDQGRDGTAEVGTGFTPTLCSEEEKNEDIVVIYDYLLMSLYLLGDTKNLKRNRFLRCILIQCIVLSKNGRDTNELFISFATQ